MWTNTLWTSSNPQLRSCATEQCNRCPHTGKPYKEDTDKMWRFTRTRSYGAAFVDEQVCAHVRQYLARSLNLIRSALLCAPETYEEPHIAGTKPPRLLPEPHVPKLTLTTFLSRFTLLNDLNLSVACPAEQNQAAGRGEEDRIRPLRRGTDEGCRRRPPGC